MDLTRVELRHLRYFVAVAEEQHFTRAAEKLHVTQPTLSHQIRELEGQLDLSLFDRVGRRVKLTAAGEMLLPHARRVIRALGEAQTELDELRGLKRGTLKVGIIQTVNACVIPEIIARFSAAHPGINVMCSEMAVADIESGVESGSLDLGISFLPPCRKNLAGQKLFAEELVAVVAADHALAKNRHLRIRDVAKHPMALLAQKFCTRQLIDRAMAEARAQPDVKVEMNSVDSILSTVRRTQLVTLLPTLALCQRDTGLKAIAVIEPSPRRSVGLLWLENAHQRATAQAFAEVTLTVLAERKLSNRESRQSGHEETMKCPK
jgi:LysR family cyn operon transcriptional activator